jgi:anti-sigma B factor antagonist
MSFFYFGDDFDDATPDGVGVLIAGGEIDYSASSELRERIDAHVQAGDQHLVLDLSAATFIDSTAIGVLVGGVAKLRGAGGSLAVVCTHEMVLNIFEITGLDRTVALHDSREQALSVLTVAG